MSSNQASRNGAARANPVGGLISGLIRMIGAAAIALAFCASAPLGALAQNASDSPGGPAAQNAPPAALGASIRKPPGAAAGGAPAAADNTAAASTSATPAGAAPAADAGGSAPAGAPASSDTSATASFVAPGATESAGAPAALATPSAHAKARTRRHAHSDSATQSASAKTDSKDTNADSKNSKDNKDGKAQEGPFSSLQFSGNKGPIDIKSDALDLDYKANVVTFRGHVHAAQADAVLTSDTLTVTYGKDFNEVKEMVANNNVRMSQGTRWATGDHAVLDQAKHTVTLTGSPVVHDGEDQVTGSKITVHLDTGKSEVEGARAVFFPKEQKTRDNKTTVAKSP